MIPGSGEGQAAVPSAANAAMLRASVMVMTAIILLVFVIVFSYFES
jgi:hypothetical protein